MINVFGKLASIPVFQLSDTECLLPDGACMFYEDGVTGITYLTADTLVVNTLASNGTDTAVASIDAVVEYYKRASFRDANPSVDAQSVQMSELVKLGTVK